MKIAHLTFVLVFSSLSISAQNYIDLVRFNYAITPQNTFDNGIPGTALREINGNLTVPVVINDLSVFLTGVTYEKVSASFDIEQTKRSYTHFLLKLGANIQHNTRWSGTYLLLPQLSSDFQQISGRDFQYGALALIKYTKSNHFNYKVGVYANKEFFGPFIVPIIGFYYLGMDKKFETKILLPLSADFNYLIAGSFRVGLSFKGQIKSYNINSTTGTNSAHYLTKSANDVYAYFQYGIQNGIHFQLACGRSIGRSYRQFNEQVSFGMPLTYFGDQRTQLNTDFSDSWLFRVSMIYRLKIK